MLTIMVTTFTRDWAATVEQVARAGGVPVTVLPAVPLGPDTTPERSGLLSHMWSITSAAAWGGGFVLEDDVLASVDWPGVFGNIVKRSRLDMGDIAVALYVPDFCRAHCIPDPATGLERYDHKWFVGNQAIWWGGRLAGAVSYWLREYDEGGGRLNIEEALRLCPHLEGRLYAMPADLFDHKPGPSSYASSEPHKAGRFTVSGFSCDGFEQEP